MNFGQLIRAKRDAAGMTLQELGDTCGITKGHLHDLENGKHMNPGLYTCTRLSVALGVPIQALASALLESRSKEAP